MSAEQAPRLSLGRRIAVGGGFLLLAAGGATVTGLAMAESMHDMGVASAAGFDSNTEAAHAAYHERRLDNYGALGGLIVVAGSTAAAAVSMRGVYTEVMRTNGQWYAGEYPPVSTPSAPSPANYAQAA